MSKITILNELRRCVEPTQEGWDVWFHGVYLGSIIKVQSGSDYYVMRDYDKKNPLGIRKNYMAAIACFIDGAMEVALDDIKELVEYRSQLRSYGVNKAQQKTVWQKIKGWFK